MKPVIVINSQWEVLDSRVLHSGHNMLSAGSWPILSK